MFRTVDCEIWDDPKFDDDMLLTYLALYLFTNPRSHVTGLYKFRPSVFCEEKKVPREQFDVAFQKLQSDDVGFCKYDSDRKIIFVINMWKRQPHSGIHLDRIPAHFKTLFDTYLINDWLDKYPDTKIDFPRVTTLSPTSHQPRTDSAPPCHDPVTGSSLQDKGLGIRELNPPLPPFVEENPPAIQDLKSSRNGKKRKTNPKSSSKKTPPKTEKTITYAINKIDFSKFQEKYPSLDIEDIEARFKNRQIGALNPQNYVDFSRGFDTWCRKELEKQTGPGIDYGKELE
jgi:hypothetical protein